jgi:endonuclease YncB( thermonuclease family)
VSVTRVVDGDTIEVSPQVEGTADVRLIGVDTPRSSGEKYNPASPRPPTSLRSASKAKT